MSSGEDRPWLEHPTDSITSVRTFGEDTAWLNVHVGPLGTLSSKRSYPVPWREQPVPAAEWIEVKVPAKEYRSAPHGSFFQFFDGAKLMAVRFDPKTHAFSEPSEVKYQPGTTETPKPDDRWSIRGPGLIFARSETSGSVWLMKLPE